jgi:hypothetical protein
MTDPRSPEAYGFDFNSLHQTSEAEVVVVDNLVNGRRENLEGSAHRTPPVAAPVGTDKKPAPAVTIIEVLSRKSSRGTKFTVLTTSSPAKSGDLARSAFRVQTIRTDRGKHKHSSPADLQSAGTVPMVILARVRLAQSRSPSPGRTSDMRGGRLRLPEIRDSNRKFRSISACDWVAK